MRNSMATREAAGATARRLALFVLVFAATHSSALIYGGKQQVVGSEKFQRAWQLYQQGKPSAEAFEAILADENEKAVDRFNAAYVLGVMATAANELDKALDFLKKADALLPGREQVAVRRAEICIAKNDLEGAQKQLKAARTASKKNSPLFAHYQVATARLEAAAGKREAGIARLEQALSVARQSWEIAFTLGVLYEQQDTPAKAIEAYGKTVELLPAGPCAGVYALQRWAAITISSDPGSYGNPTKVLAAIESYEKFLARAPENRVPAEVITATTQAVNVLKYFQKK